MHKNKWNLGKVVLKVADLNNMSAFYQDYMGIEVLTKEDKNVTLGLKIGLELVELVQIEKPAQKKMTAGLYHLALLLPSRAALGEYLYYLLEKRFPVQGASDHGYSEAIYFNDPEGNGIEVYADKPMSEWDIREGGRVEGITIAMDAEGVIGSIEKRFDGLPEGTIMGHVHLTVNNLPDAGTFYEEIVGLGLKSDYFGQAKFFASGDYHHHVGSNTWAGKNLPQPEAEQTGLAYFTWELPTEEEYQDLIARLEKHNWPYEKENDVIVVKDNSGIEQHFAVK